MKINPEIIFLDKEEYERMRDNDEFDYYNLYINKEDLI